MAKWFGKIGYASTLEVEPGIWEEQIIEREYYGDVIRNVRRLQNSKSINDDINISNQISILADPYANENIYAMRYAEFSGAKWKVNSVDIQYPRLILELSGVWNGEQAKIAE